MKRLAVPIQPMGLFLLLASIAAAQTPTISLLTPNTVSSGYPTFTMNVLGGGFLPSDGPSFSSSSPTATEWNASNAPSSAWYRFAPATMPASTVSWPATPITPPGTSGSYIIWQRASGPELELPTVWIGSGEVRATIDTSLVSSPGTVSVRVENRFGDGDSSFSNAVIFTITPGVEIITPPNLPDGTPGVFYSKGLEATGGTPPYTWRFFEGELPPGLTLLANGTITGTPTEPGKYSAQIGVMDTEQMTDDRVFVIEIVAKPLTNLTESPLPSSELGEFYIQALNASGGRPPYFWEHISGELPPGLTVSLDGIISGQPTIPGLYKFEVQVNDQAEGSLTKEFELLVIGPLEITTPSPLPQGTEGVVYTQALEATGGRPPYLWSLDGALQTGLSLGPDGVIGGTPMSTGSYSFTARVMDRREDVARKQFELLVGVNVPPLTITTPPQLPDATTDSAYTTALKAEGGETPYTWFLEEGELPAGLMLDSASGVISGPPTQAGDYSFEIAVEDAAKETDSQVFRLNVGRPQLIVTTASPLPEGTVGQTYNSSFAATGGAPPYTWTQIGGTLPPGLTLSSSGVLDGTPTTDGTFTFGARATDEEKEFADKNFQVRVRKGAISIVTDPILPQGAVGDNYSTTVAATSGIPPYTWTLIQGGLPPGVDLSSTGMLSGVPTEGGDFGFRLRVTDDTGGAAEQNFAIRVNAPPLPDISVAGLPDETNPTDPQTLRVSISGPYPADLTGTATLEFAPDATEPADDPAVQFSTGGRSVQFTIPAGSTTAMFGSGESVGIQTGSVAGVITTNTVIGSGEDAVRDSQQMRVRRAAPSISVTANRVTGGFEVRVTGFSSPRDMTSARFQFSAASGADLQTNEVTVQLGDVFGDWYRNDDSDQYGSTFVYTQPFTIQGDANAVNGVTVTLTNSAGTSEAATANF